MEKFFVIDLGHEIGNISYKIDNGQCQIKVKVTVGFGIFLLYHNTKYQVL